MSTDPRPEPLGLDTDGVVQLVGVSKAYGSVQALRPIDLTIRRGEFFTLLGASGCGKTTTLRLIAGFEAPSSGRVVIAGQDMTGQPAHRRPVNTVFQNYALFPHLTVARNVAFGLEVKGVAAAARADRVREALALVKLEALADRKPAALSGGQQQRVALARALVNRPSVLLLDEPLAALDLKLRRAMQTELKTMQRQLGITFVFVTHDQEEALTLSDRIALMRDGRILQIGDPRTIYERPSTRYGADFIGETNFLPATLLAPADPGGVSVRVAGQVVTLEPPEAGPVPPPGAVTLAIRPEALAIAAADAALQPGQMLLAGRVQEVVYLGTDRRLVVALDGIGTVTARLQNRRDGAPVPGGPGVPVTLACQIADLRLVTD